MKQRHLVPELMDNPDLDEVEHRRALAGLRRINLLCGTSRFIADSIMRSSASIRNRPIEILDLGCGSGDIAMNVLRRLHSQKTDCRVTGWDMSPLAADLILPIAAYFSIILTSSKLYPFFRR
jgi:SAM-dependent methyltransferase